MRISIITEGYYPEISGVTTSLHNRLLCLSSARHQVQVFAPDYSEVNYIYPDYLKHKGNVMPGVEVISYPSKPYMLEHLRDPKPFSMGFCEEHIRKFRPDIIHVDCPERLFMGFLRLPGVKVAKELGIPVTAFYHTNYLGLIPEYKSQAAFLRVPFMDKALTRLVKWVYSHYQTVMVSTSYVESILKNYGIVNLSRSQFFGIDKDIFNPELNLVFPEKKAGKFIVSYIGRMARDKHIEVILGTFDVLRRNHKNIHFFLAGKGQEDALVSEYAQRYDDVTFAGQVSNREVADFYRNSDVIVSACPKETLGLTAVEALACGVPFVAPQAGGLSEIVKHRETGFLVPVDDISAFSDAISFLYNNPGILTTMKLNCIREAASWSWQNGTNNMLDVWQEHIHQMTVRQFPLMMASL